MPVSYHSPKIRRIQAEIEQALYEQGMHARTLYLRETGIQVGDDDDAEAILRTTATRITLDLMDYVSRSADIRSSEGRRLRWVEYELGKFRDSLCHVQLAFTWGPGTDARPSGL